MSAVPTADELRIRVAAHLERLHELTLHRNHLLHHAGSGVPPTMVRALRANRQLADAVRAAARRARAQLARLESSGVCAELDPVAHARSFSQ